jgi:GntR family transcriptional regulator
VLASIDGLLENSLVMGKDTGVALLEFDYVPADRTVAEALELAPGTPVQMAVRMRRTGSTPFSYLTTWLPESVGRSFKREELGTIPLVVLLERAGVRLTSAEQVIGAENATGAVAAVLGVDPGAALMTMVRTLRDENGRPVEYTKILYNPRLYQYRMMLERLPASSGQGWRSRSEPE